MKSMLFFIYMDKFYYKWLGWFNAHNYENDSVLEKIEMWSHDVILGSAVHVD